MDADFLNVLWQGKPPPGDPRKFFSWDKSRKVDPKPVYGLEIFPRVSLCPMQEVSADLMGNMAEVNHS